MGLPALDQLVGPVAHALLPLARLEAPGVIPEPVEDVVDAGCPAQVGAESRQAVIDDVRVRVVETGKDGCAGQVDESCAGAPKGHDLAAAAGQDLAARDGEVAVGVET